MDWMEIAMLVIFGLVGLCWLVVRFGEWSDGQYIDEQIAAGGQLAAREGPIAVYKDPPRLDIWTRGENGARPERTSFPLTPNVKADVEAAGNVSVTRGRDLGAKAMGTLALPGVGMFIAGNAKEKIHDNRELYLVIEGDDWARTLPVNPDHGVGVRRLAQTINLIARSAAESPEALIESTEAISSQEASFAATSSPTADATDTIQDRLRRLDELKDTGVVTDDEYAGQRQRILSSL